MDFRLKEGTTLQVTDVDLHRMLVHIRHVKGDKDRYVPLSHRTLELLEELWLGHQHPIWLFPSGGVEIVQGKSVPYPVGSFLSTYRGVPMAGIRDKKPEKYDFQAANCPDRLVCL